MTNLTNIPLQDNFETTLAQELNTTGTTVYINSTPDFTFPASTTSYAVLNPGKTNMEVVKINAYDSSAGTITIATRNIDQGASVSTTAQTHSVGSKLKISNSYKFWSEVQSSVNTKLDNDADTTWGAATDFAGLVVKSLTTAQRTALSPSNGSIVYDTDLGVLYQYIGGSWGSVDTGTSTPNATTLVAGKVEMATSAESKAGTDSGGTGASLVVFPSHIAANVQDSSYVFAADAGGSDAYAITLSPAPSAYATGQRFTFTANTVNTGTATLNVNTLGAKTIKKQHDQTLSNGDIESGSVVDVIYDGTDFQLQTPLATDDSDFIPATSGYATGTPGARVSYGGEISLADSATEYSSVSFYAKKTPSAINMVWSTYASSGNLYGSFGISSCTTGEIWNNNVDTSSDAVVDASGGLNVINSVAFSNLGSITVSPGDYVGIRFLRTGGHASDTINDEVEILGFLITY